jgi:hypothetical protein
LTVRVLLEGVEFSIPLEEHTIIKKAARGPGF